MVQEQKQGPSAGASEAKPRIAEQGCFKSIPLIGGRAAFCNEHRPIGPGKDWDHFDTKAGMQFLGFREAPQ